MPLSTPSRIVQELASRGYNAEREAVTLLASAADPALALEAAVDHAPDDALRLTANHIRAVLDAEGAADAPTTELAPSEPESPTSTDTTSSNNPSVSTGTTPPRSGDPAGGSPDETKGSSQTAGVSDSMGSSNAVGAGDAATDNTATDDTTTADTSTDDNSKTAADAPTTADATDAADITDTATTGITDTADTTATTADTTATTADTTATTDAVASGDADEWSRNPVPDARSLTIDGDVTGQSTGTGEYKQFVRTFRDRYERLSSQLRGRVNHRPATAIQDMPGGDDAELIGLVNDVRSTASGHWLIELEDTTGTFPCLVMKDKNIADLVDELLMDECLAVQGTLADDAGILFVDTIYFPDVPRTYQPSTAERHVQAALISDVHVGSQEFHAEAWKRFADWLHTEEASHVEYLLIAGDMVEGVGIYPDQDEELDIIDIYEQYETFSERLKEVPGDMEIVMIPGNHDAVRLAEPQPGFDDELREIMSAHDAQITGNPSTVTIEGVSVLMYHGVSLDEVIAELPEEKASYDEPHRAMYQLLKKRHVAPQYGGHMRLAPEEKDYLVIDDVPDVFHTGHVHKLGWGKYHNVLSVNSGCWQKQTAFQQSVNIDPDVGYAPILDLDTLDMTVRKFS